MASSETRGAAAPPRLYLVTPPAVTEAVLRDVEELIETFPIACVRLALATADEGEIRRCADRLRAICHEREVNIVIAEHFRLSRELGLDGVHLTGTRLVREARKHLGSDAIVGAFCGTSRHEGMNAAEIGADYVSFGPLTVSALGDGSVAPTDLFAWWSEMIEIPVVAEGGATADAAAAVAPYADFLALGAELWADPAGPHAALAAVAARLPPPG